MIAPLTSLRFIFALMVFGAHCYVIDSFFDAHFFKEGFVGVSFFFVLSGFIISYNYQRKLQEKQTSRRTFWVARIARVYPLHWLTLFVAALLGNYVTATNGWDWFKHFLASLTLTNAYIPQVDYFFSFNSPSWSLCCEQLFYFCFPFLVPLAQNYKRLLSVWGVSVVLLLTGMYFTPEEAIKGYWYVNPVTRLPDFLVGMLLFRCYEGLKNTRECDGDCLGRFVPAFLSLCSGSAQGLPLFLLLLGAGCNGLARLFPPERHTFPHPFQPFLGDGRGNQLQFLPDTPVCAFIVCGMAKGEWVLYRMVHLRADSVWLHCRTESAFLPLFRKADEQKGQAVAQQRKHETFSDK